MASYLITGSARGIGLEMVTQLSTSKETSIIFATSRSESPALKELVSSSSGKVFFIKLDTTDESSIAAAVKEVEAILNDKGLDVLVNNAGIMAWNTGGLTGM